MAVPSVGGVGVVLNRIGQIEAQISGLARQPGTGSTVTSSGSSTESSTGASFASVYQSLSSEQYSTVTSSGLYGGSTVTGSSDGLAGAIGRAGIPVGTPYAAEFAAAGDRHGVPAPLLAAIGWVESRYRADAVSADGALGVMQIMPATARALGVDQRVPSQAIDGAARLLADHFDRFGSWDLAVAAYFSGAGAVARNGNQAPPGGAAYVDRVARRLEEIS